MKASARKSYGEYKPMIVHPGIRGRSRSEIVGQRGHMQRIQPQTKFYEGPTEIWHARRGVTFKDRAEAIAYAQKVIDVRKAAHEKYMADYEARQARYAAQRANQ